MKYLTLWLSALFSYQLHAAGFIITVENIEKPHGTINIALFTEAGDFPNPVSREQGLTLVATQDSVEAKFLEIPENNKYAIAVYHDVNGNNELDKNFFGIPKEPYGFSGNSNAPDPPNFMEASHYLKDDDIYLIIKLR